VIRRGDIWVIHPFDLLRVGAVATS